MLDAPAGWDYFLRAGLGRADSWVALSESGMLTPSYVVVSIVMRRGCRPNEHMSFVACEYCMSCVTMLVPGDRDTACKPDSQYHKYDGQY